MHCECEQHATKGRWHGKRLRLTCGNCGRVLEVDEPACMEPPAQVEPPAPQVDAGRWVAIAFLAAAVAAFLWALIVGPG